MAESVNNNANSNNTNSNNTVPPTSGADMGKGDKTLTQADVDCMIAGCPARKQKKYADDNALKAPKRNWIS
jgi:hypothetical protein